jgi:hypothetical protein
MERSNEALLEYGRANGSDGKSNVGRREGDKGTESSRTRKTGIGMFSRNGEGGRTGGWKEGGGGSDDRKKK